MKTAKQYRSTDQKKLKVLCDLACDNIEELLDYFDLDYLIDSYDQISIHLTDLLIFDIYHFTKSFLA